MIIVMLLIAVWYVQQHIAPRRYHQPTTTTVEPTKKQATTPLPKNSPENLEPSTTSTDLPLLDPFTEQETELDTLQAEIDSLSL